MDGVLPRPRSWSSSDSADMIQAHCGSISTTAKMFLLGVCLCLGVVHGIIPETSQTDMDIIANMETNVSQGQTTLNDMFKDVKKLMEDTQKRLEDAVNLVDNETAKSGVDPRNVSSNLQNESSVEIMNGNQTITGNQSGFAAEKNDETTHNVTDETTITRTTESSDTVNSTNHQCVINEDCERGKFCLYETNSSQCLPCKQLDATCSKDEECCAGQLCVWGQCANNSTKGEAGTICQYQSDCKEDFCCAFHKALLFAVCSSKPIERERCVISAKHLLELLSWNVQEEGPQRHCPCAGDLECQHHGRGALCLKSQNSSEEELSDTLYSNIDYII